MFGNIFNTLTGQGQNNNVPPEGGTAPPPADAPQQGGGNESFLSGLMNVAQGVGKSLAEKSQEGAEAVKSGANTVAVTTTTTAEGAGRMTKEQMDNLAAGISDLVGKAAGAFSQNKSEVEEQITAVDAQGGKIQVSSVSDGTDTTTKVIQKPQEGSDFLSGLMEVAKQVGQAIGDRTQEGADAVKSGASSVADTTKSTAEGAGKLTKEQMDQIASGISSLVGKAAGAFSTNKTEEQITSVDSQGGKVQISSVSDGTSTATTITSDKSAEGKDFLSGLIDVAKQVGQSISEKSHEKDVESRALPADTSKATSQGAKEDLDKLSAGIGDLIGKAAEALHIGGEKKETSPEPAKTEGGNALLSGLMGLAKDITKKVGEPKAEETFDTSKPEIDDVEGEIGKITTMGYTSEEKQSTEKEPGLIASVVDKSKEMASEAAGAVGNVAGKAVDTVKGGAHFVVDTAKSGAETVIDKTKEIGGAVKDTTVSAGESAIDMTKRGVSTVVNTAAEGAGYVAGATVGLVERGASAVVDTGKSGVNAVYEGASAIGTYAKDGASSTVDSVKSGTNAIYEGASSAAEKTKELGISTVDSVKSGAEAVVDKSKELGGSAIETVKSGATTTAGLVKSGATAAADNVRTGANAIYEGAASTAEKTKELGSSAVESVRSRTGEAIDKTKEMGGSAFEKSKEGVNFVSEKAEKGFDYAVEGTRHLGEKMKESGEAVIDKTKELGGAVRDTTSSAYTSIAEGAKETGETAKGIATERAREGADLMKEGWESGKESVRKTTPLEEKSIIPEKAERSPESSEDRVEGVISDISRDIKEGYTDLKEAALDAGDNLKYQLQHGEERSEAESAERQALRMEEEGGMSQYSQQKQAEQETPESKILRTGELPLQKEEEEGTDIPPERQPEGTNESMEGKEQDEGGSIVYDSALEVGNAILSGAATLAEAVRDTTGVVIASVFEGADNIDEETMYGPDREKSEERERRSMSPSPQDNSKRLQSTSEVLDVENKEAESYGFLHPALQPGVKKDPALENLVAFTSPPRPVQSNPPVLREERQIPVETSTAPIEVQRIAVVSGETMSDVFGRNPEAQLISGEERFDLSREEFPPLGKEEFRERVDSHLSSSSWKSENETRAELSGKIPISQPGTGSKNNLLKSSDMEEDEGVGSFKELHLDVDAERRPATAAADVSYPPRTYEDRL